MASDDEFNTQPLSPESLNSMGLFQNVQRMDQTSLDRLVSSRQFHRNLEAARVAVTQRARRLSQGNSSVRNSTRDRRRNAADAESARPPSSFRTEWAAVDRALARTVYEQIEEARRTIQSGDRQGIWSRFVPEPLRAEPFSPSSESDASRMPSDDEAELEELLYLGYSDNEDVATDLDSDSVEREEPAQSMKRHRPIVRVINSTLSPRDQLIAYESAQPLPFVVDDCTASSLVSHRVENIMRPNASYFSVRRRTNVGIRLRFAPETRDMGIPDAPTFTVTHVSMCSPMGRQLAPCIECMIFISHEPVKLNRLLRYNDFTYPQFQEFMAKYTKDPSILQHSDPVPLAYLRPSYDDGYVDTAKVPALSGRYIFVKPLRSSKSTANLDLQYIAIRGFAGPVSSAAGDLN
ncbi:hypothetical protein IWQ62_004837 [Dispira parvispora]|uniref:Uncharacterized protein n=1 Tax=Dispira parvispora TaxID=1520584 RepID=A0A9W8ARK9_9FUNG|nr:hypothetical protein IWQ62_004837 [Dispira parvispora]